VKKHIKKTVAIHPVIDDCIRKVRSMLIYKGYNVTYSTALNFLLLGGALEMLKEDGWSDDTRKHVWSIIIDKKHIQKLDLQELLTSLQI
jgi:hypothetical protein